jgi:lipopolysaccharide export system permease protein
MSTLSRYIAALYLKLIGLCLGSFVAIYLVIDFLEKIDRFTQKQGSLLHIVLFFLCKIPEIISQVIPMAVLMATLLTLGLLARNNEITAMKGSGISLPRMSAPILTIALCFSLLTILVNEFVVPRTYHQMKYIEQVLIGKQSYNTFFRQNNIWYREENLILQAKIFDPTTNTLSGITIWNTEANSLPVGRLDAKKAVIGQDGWQLYNVSSKGFTEHALTRNDQIEQMPIRLGLKADDLKVVDKSANNMGFLQLYRYAEKLSKGGYDPTRYLAQMHAKISLPFASLIMAFLGIPFSLRGGRTSGIAMGIGASLGIGFTYFIINSILVSFGQTGVLSPAISAWAANFIFAGSGIWLAMTTND